MKAAGHVRKHALDNDQGPMQVAKCAQRVVRDEVEERETTHHSTRSIDEHEQKQERERERAATQRKYEARKKGQAAGADVAVAESARAAHATYPQVSPKRTPAADANARRRRAGSERPHISSSSSHCEIHHMARTQATPPERVKMRCVRVRMPQSCHVYEVIYVI